MIVEIIQDLLQQLFYGPLFMLRSRTILCLLPVPIVISGCLITIMAIATTRALYDPLRAVIDAVERRS